jgi:predicted DNA-binding transcriptional regulator YafY
MKDVKILDEPREGEKLFEDIDLTKYIRSVFGMYGGTKETVTLRFINSLLDTVVDRFGVGANATYVPDDKNHFKVIADVEISPQFFGWICGFGNRVVIEKPQNVVEQFQKHIEKIQSKYKE